jgi:hypothetical protein
LRPSGLQTARRSFKIKDKQPIANTVFVIFRIIRPNKKDQTQNRPAVPYGTFRGFCPALVGFKRLVAPLYFGLLV